MVSYVKDLKTSVRIWTFRVASRSKVVAKPIALALAGTIGLSLAAPGSAENGAALKREVAAEVEARSRLVQQTVDSIYSFAEPGFQEFKTSDYLVRILEANGFRIVRGVSGIPTAFTATWGEGGPLIAMGSDVDALPGLSQTPGVSTISPQVAGAPGHGEGHNSGMAAVVAAAISTKAVMERRGIKGRLLIWPGVAEELLGAKAFYVRDGMFKGVDACIFLHVATDFSTGWGDMGYTTMVSIQYDFKGKAAHAAVNPWDGRSALDGVELMDIAWDMRREHLPLSQRSHHVIVNGGDQPNIVPAAASVWYYFREKSFASLRMLYETGNEIAEAAAKATGTTVDHTLLGYASPVFANKPMAEAAYANLKIVGMPRWTADDQAFARAVQQANGLKIEPLSTTVPPLSTPDSRDPAGIGGSDDIGAVTWAVPTIILRYPANIPNVIFHNATAGMAMATPIAHKGTLAGAKALAMTIVDLMTRPKLISEAKNYLDTVQMQNQKYDPLLTDSDQPAIHMNDHLMNRMRPKLSPFYYDPGRYGSYLDQLGISYP